MVNADRLLQEFIELAKVYSPSGREGRMAAVLKDKLVQLGLEVIEDDAGPLAGSDTGNIIARMPPGTHGGRVIMFCAHMDTVEPAEGVEPVVEGGIVRSRGNTVLGADDKAGIAAILEALRVVKENSIEHGGIEVVFTVHEEGGLLGAKNLDFSLLRAKAGFVLDSDGQPGTIVTMAPSQDKIEAIVFGKSAHAGLNPEEGINAIQAASAAIARMKLGRIDYETTSNIGVISGGKATNIVPDKVVIQGEARSHDENKLRAQTEHMCRCLREAAAEYGGRVEVMVENQYRSFHLKEDSLPVKIAAGAAARLGFTPSIVKTGGGSDANIFNERGIPSVVLGIGMKKVHTTQEYISLEDLTADARYIVEIIEKAREL